MTEEWDFEVTPAGRKAAEPQPIDISFSQILQVREHLAAGYSLKSSAAMIHRRSADVDRALWSWIGVKFRRENGTLTVE